MPPKRHQTHGKTRRRRSHHALTPAVLLACSHCGSAVLPHRVCRECGYYRGSEVIDVLAHAEKKTKRKEAKMKERVGEKRAAEPSTLEELSKKQ